jgi:hypothetical protein
MIESRHQSATTAEAPSASGVDIGNNVELMDSITRLLNPISLTNAIQVIASDKRNMLLS